MFTAYDLRGQIFKSKLTRRHKVYLADPDNFKIKSRISPIEILVSVQPPASSPPKSVKTFLDLSPEVQKELIKRLGMMENTGSDMMEQLKKNFSNKTSTDASIEIVDMTEMKRQIIVGVFNNSLYPGDRINRVNATIKTSSTEVYFTSCDAVITKYETLEISKQTQTTNLGFEVGGNVGSTVVSNTSETGTNVTGNETTSNNEVDKLKTGQKNTTSNTEVSGSNRQSTIGLGANTKFNASRSRTEEGRLKQRYVALSGNVLNKGVKLYTESISGIDLTGNIIAEVNFKFSNTTSDFIHSFEKLFQANGTAETPANIVVKPKFVMYPTLTGDVSMDVISVDAVLRAVVENQRTIMEGDDKIAMIEYAKIAPSESPIVLVRQSDAIPRRWVIKTDNGRLRIRTSAAGAGTAGVLYFDSIHQANAFLQWLRELPAATIGAGSTLPLGGGRYALYLQNETLASFLTNCIIVTEQ